MTPARRVVAALDALWYADAPLPEAERTFAEPLLSAGVLDPWPWRRDGVHAAPVVRRANVGPRIAPARPGPLPVAITVLPHHPGVVDQPWWADPADGARFVVAELPDGLPPDLRSVPDTTLDALAAPHVRAPDGADPRSPIWVQGEAGLRWQVVLRRLGSRRPFVHVPHANPVVGDLPLAALAAARCRLPGDTVLAGSPSAAASWGRLGFAADPHYPFGVGVTRLSAPPAAVARARAALGAAPALLYTGRLDADKGLFGLLDAYAQVRAVRPVSLVIAWRGGHPAVARLVRERAAEIGGVRIVEDPPAELYAALHGACSVAVTAATSPFETFGRSPAEALAVGLPLVAPAWGPLRDLLQLAPPGAAFPVSLLPGGGPARVAVDALATRIEEALAAGPPPREALGPLLASLAPSTRFAHAVAVSHAAAGLAGEPGDDAHALPSAWDDLDAALGRASPSTLRAAPFGRGESTTALLAAREAVRADWFGGWGP